MCGLLRDRPCDRGDPRVICSFVCDPGWHVGPFDIMLPIPSNQLRVLRATCVATTKGL
jgi:hypothetical protein